MRMKRLILYTLLFFSAMFAVSFTTPEQRRELVWGRVMADGTPNKYAGWDANGDPVELDGATVVGEGSNNELQKIDGTGAFQGSGVFSSVNGDLTLGDGTATAQGITVSTNTTPQGGGFVLLGEAGKSGNNNGGYIRLAGGLPSGTGFTGTVMVNSGSVSNGTAFQVYSTSNQTNLIGAYSGSSTIFTIAKSGIMSLIAPSGTEGYMSFNVVNQNTISGTVSDATPIDLSLTGGTGGASFNSGQGVSLLGGDAYPVSGNGNGGNVTLSPGTPRGTGTQGYVVLQNIPTASPCATAPSGTVWSNAGVLTICP